MANFRTIFEAYGGEYDQTMMRFADNEDLYLRLLGMLMQDPNMATLDTALKGGDLETAFAAAHTLKGVAANMGLTPLLTAVGAIVEPLRARQADAEYPALYCDIAREFERVKVLQAQLSQC